VFTHSGFIQTKLSLCFSSQVDTPRCVRKLIF